MAAGTPDIAQTYSTSTASTGSFFGTLAIIASTAASPPNASVSAPGTFDEMVIFLRVLSPRKGLSVPHTKDAHDGALITKHL